MMHRYIRRIPRVNLSGAFALGRALLAATDLVPRLSEPVLRARKLLESRLELLAARSLGHESNPQGERTALALAGRSLDASWVALHDWLEALGALPAHHEASRTAVELLMGIFPHGMALVRPPPLLEWAESEARLARMEKGGFEATLWALGGKPFVETIQSTHAHYAKLLSHAESGAWSSRMLKQCLDGVVYAIHAYVATIIAELFDGSPESTDQTSALLGPLDFVQYQGDVRAVFFEQTLDAFPPPPPASFDRPSRVDKQPMCSV